MKNKLLPLPIGEEAPRGSEVRSWHQHSFRTRVDSAVLLLGLLLAAAGAWLGLHPSLVSVGVDRTGYRLGGVVLAPVAAGIYSGDTAVVIYGSDREVRAAAAGRLGIRPMQGVCVYAVGANSEQCQFVVGTERFHARDEIHGGTWHRRYDNGRTVDLWLADRTHPTPVPIPIGWP